MQIARLRNALRHSSGVFKTKSSFSVTDPIKNTREINCLAPSLEYYDNNKVFSTLKSPHRQFLNFNILKRIISKFCQLHRLGHTTWQQCAQKHISEYLVRIWSHGGCGYGFSVLDRDRSWTCDFTDIENSLGRKFLLLPQVGPFQVTYSLKELPQALSKCNSLPTITQITSELDINSSFPGSEASSLSLSIKLWLFL